MARLFFFYMGTHFLVAFEGKPRISTIFGAPYKTTNARGVCVCVSLFLGGIATFWLRLKRNHKDTRHFLGLQKYPRTTWAVKLNHQEPDHGF